MLRQDSLPSEFSSISNAVNYVVKRTPTEWSGSCPQCGGQVHKNGEFPDRFRMFLNAHGMNKVFGWCRACGYTWFPNRDKEPSKEEVEAWRKQQEEVERSRKEAAERALELLNNEKIWEKFHGQNNDWSRRVFRDWGIADSWIEYLQLGLLPDFVVKRGEDSYHSPAATIPIWNVGGVVQNIKLRILNPKCGGDRYRNFYSLGQSFLFVPLYDLPLSGVGVIVEGEKKSIVLEQTLNNPSFRVVGLPSLSPDPTIFDQLKNLDPIYLWLDPDGFNKVEGKESPVERNVRLIGKERVRVVQSPIKVDDGIVKYGLNPWSYLKMARKMA